MAGGQTDIYNVDAQVVNVGLSAYIGVTAGIGVVSMKTQLVSGGTCFMIGASAIGASLTALTFSASNILTFGFAYLGTNPVVDAQGPAAFYLASVGATSVMQILRYRSASTVG